jgi:hypothetical protein
MLRTIAIVGAMFIVLASITAAAAPLPARTSDAGGVKVVATPKTVNAPVWEFEIVMDTHTRPLTEDLVGLATLSDNQGATYRASAWKGDPPGGHHRKGVLQFLAPAAKPAFVELKIQSIAGVQRIFRWDLQ